MPVDAARLAGVTPTDLGLSDVDSRVVVVVSGTHVGHTLAVVATDDLVRIYRPHWASCTNPDRFRKG